ncbi:hypothetical protein OZX67_07165 [Bifidobacterium sp. ESL0728]|uniref:hypothetical protein n=1 Tax=Bifidobacterium sp. ESL0728 TaxID=2983220 RepID=UPI0023F97DA4|nr:hypothetical protein [Bifidobacterium sp. ESL0728]WEV58577.1 hypothetical protein OZX67_07165 [Bifidobacterium sp. ESL0728]
MEGDTCACGGLAYGLPIRKTRLRGPRRWWRGLCSWLYADRKYLNGPPAWAANK